MKVLKKIVVMMAFLLSSVSLFAFDLTQFTNPTKVKDTIGNLDSGLYDFSKQLGHSVPQAATQQNVWADAFIGKSFPSIPPHLGGGVNIAMTRVDTSGLAKVADILDIGGISNSYYFPVFTADVRVGGLFFPFDLDIAIMKTGVLSTDAFGADLSVDFFTIGADFRYAILEGGIILPKLSVGLGYFYNQGSFSAGSKEAEASVDYKIHTMYAQVQVSKSLFFLTPFVGLRALVSKCDNSYSWKLKGDIEQAVKVAGVVTQKSGSYGKGKFDFGELQPQVYAGVGFNFLIMQATLSLSADLRHLWDNGLWSGAFSFRVKL